MGRRKATLRFSFGWGKKIVRPSLGAAGQEKKGNGEEIKNMGPTK